MEQKLREAIVAELRDWANTAEPSLQQKDTDVDDSVTLYAPFLELGLNLIRNTATLIENDR